MSYQRPNLGFFLCSLSLGVAQIGCTVETRQPVASISKPKASPTPSPTQPGKPGGEVKPNTSDATKSLSLVNVAADGYINARESESNEPVLGDAEVQGELASYAVVAADAECSEQTAYEYPLPTAKAVADVDNAEKKICVRYRNELLGSYTYKASAKIIVDKTPPEFAYRLAVGNMNQPELVPLLAAGQSAEFLAVAAESGSGLKSFELKPEDVNFVGNGEGCVAKIIDAGKFEKRIVVSGCNAERKEFAVAIRPGLISDLAGNTNLGLSKSERLGVYSKPPELVINEPKNNTRTKEVISLSGRCQSEDSLRIFIANQAVGDPLTCRDAAFNSSVRLPGEDGVKMLKVVSTDKAGQKTEVSRDFIKDNAGPVIEFSLPSVSRITGMGSGKTVTETLYRFSIKDNDVPGEMRSLMIDNSKFTSSGTDSAQCSSLVVDQSMRTIKVSGCSGNGTVKVVAAAGAVRDEAGNDSSVSESAPVTVDNEGPTNLAILSPSVGTKFDRMRVSATSISGTCEAGGQRVELTGATGSSACSSAGTFEIKQWSFLSSDNFKGEKSIGVRQLDRLGNSGSSQVVKIELAPFFLNNLSSISGLVNTVMGQCENVAGESFSATTSADAPAKVISSSCSSTGLLQVVLHLKAGATASFNLTVERKKADGSVSAQVKDVPFARNAFVCPEGYVGVPRSNMARLGHVSASTGNTQLHRNTARDFCVMKYPAKKDPNDKALSVAAGSPWVKIQRGIDSDDANVMSGAIKACYAIGANADVGKYRLISNTQWQTVARNIESVAANWTNNVVGSGRIYRGHTDNSPGNTIPASTDDLPYSGTGNSAGSDQKRTHMLSNGETVWDFAGNVWQWVRDNAGDIGISPALTQDSLEFSNTSFFPVVDVNANTNRLLFGPSGSFSSAQSAGRVSAFTSNVQGIARGGHFGANLDGGVFAARNFDVINHTSDNTGFRCVYIP